MATLPERYHNSIQLVPRRKKIGHPQSVDGLTQTHAMYLEARVVFHQANNHVSVLVTSPL